MKKDPKKTELPDELEIINADAIIGIKMSTSYFQRVQRLYTTLIAEKNHAELQKAFEQISNKKIEDDWVYNLETLMILITEFQKNAKLEKQTKMISKEDFIKLVDKP